MNDSNHKLDIDLCKTESIQKQIEIDDDKEEFDCQNKKRKRNKWRNKKECKYPDLKN